MDGQPKTLIIDDERFYINVLVELLKKDYKLYIAKSGEQGLQRLTCNKPDLILLDIMMPDMDGYQTCLKIKASPQWSKIPIIFLSGDTQRDSKAKAFDIGAIDFISKPFPPHTVQARIKKHLSRSSVQEMFKTKNTPVPFS